MGSSKSQHLSVASGDSLDREKNLAVPFIAGDPALHQEDARLKQNIRFLRFFARLGATILAIVTMSQEARSLALFIRTEHVQANGRGPWAKQTHLWPSIMLLSISAVTVVSGCMIMSAYAYSIRRANNIATVQSWFIWIVETVHIITWIVVAVLYRVGKTGKDLWGWACSPVAEKIQPTFEGVVNFNKVCSRGTNQWRLALASASLQILTAIVFYLMWQRRKVKKSIKSEGL